MRGATVCGEVKRRGTGSGTGTGTGALLLPGVRSCKGDSVVGWLDHTLRIVFPDAEVQGDREGHPRDVGNQQPSRRRLNPRELP